MVPFVTSVPSRCTSRSHCRAQARERLFVHRWPVGRVGLVRFHNMEIESDHGCYELLLDPATSRQMLVETITEEKVILEEGEWSLHNDANGRFFLSCAGQEGATWCQGLMQHCVITDPETEQVFVVSSDGNGMALEEYQQRHHAVTLPIRLPGHGRPVQIVVFVLRQSVSGAWALWSLSSWFQECVGEVSPTTCSRWYQNWWQWWTKHIGCLGMDSAHLRKPVVGNAGASSTTESHLRFLPDPVLSSGALIVLLSRWSADSKSSKDKNELVKVAWRTALQGVLQTFFGQGDNVDWVIFLDMSVVVRPGLPLDGSNQVLVPVRDGFVGITPVLSCDEPAVLQSLVALGEVASPGRLHLHELCMKLDSAGRKCQWLFKQVVHNIACGIGSAILESMSGDPDGEGADGARDGPDVVPPEAMLAGRVAGQRARKAKKLRGKYTIKAFLPNSQRRRVLQYSFCLRSKFQEERRIQVAFDASRVGNLDRMIGFISRPDNVGGWLAPQATRGVLHSGHTKLFSGMAFSCATQRISAGGGVSIFGLHKDFSRDIRLHKDFS